MFNLADFLHVAIFHEFLGSYDVFRDLRSMHACMHAHAFNNACIEVVPLPEILRIPFSTEIPKFINFEAKLRFLGIAALLLKK